MLCICICKYLNIILSPCDKYIYIYTNIYIYVYMHVTCYIYIHICKYFHYHHFPNLRGNSKCTYIYIDLMGGVWWVRHALKCLPNPNLKIVLKHYYIYVIYMYIYIYIYIYVTCYDCTKARTGTNCSLNAQEPTQAAHRIAEAAPRIGGANTSIIASAALDRNNSRSNSRCCS